jgi:hypothetical protein
LQAEILNQSGYQHDYVIGTFEYIEDRNDTSKLKYIATLKITDKTYNYKGVIGRWLYERFYSTAHKLGADAFCLKKYSCSDSNATIIIDVYFAGNNFLKINQSKRIKNKIYLFGEKGKAKKDTAKFYLNDTLTKFNTAEYFIINASLDKKYNLALGKDSTTNRPVMYTTEGQARFFMIPNYTPPHEITKRNGKKKMISGSDVGYLMELYGYSTKNYRDGYRIIELGYDKGKFLSDIWK